MNEKGILFAALGAAAVVISLLVGFVTGWSPYTLLVVGLLAGSVLALWFYLRLRAYREASPTPRRLPPSGVTEPSPSRVTVGPVLLETATPDFRLAFSATVLWRPCRTEQSPAAPIRRLPSHPERTPAEPTPAPRTAESESAPPASGPPAAAESGPAEPTAVPPTADEPELADPTPDEPAPAPQSSITEASEPASPAAEAPVGRTPSGQDEEQPDGDTAGRWHADLGALATAAAAAAAAEIVLGSAAVDVGTTKQRLAAELGWPRTDSSGTVRWCAQDVDLQPADPDDAARLRTLSQLRKQVQVWQQEREHELNVRRYLDEDVLTTTGSALVWWLARHLDDVRGAIGMIGDLSELSAVSQDRGASGRAGGTPVAPPATVVGSNDGRGIGPDVAATVDLLERLFPGSEDERMMFARDLAMIAERSGRIDYARRVRRMFGVPDLTGSPPEPTGEGQPEG